MRVSATAQGARLVLVSSPALDNAQERQTRASERWRMQHLNELAEAFATTHPDTVSFVDLAAYVCADPACPDLTRLRPDGLHHDLQGSREAAAWLLPELQDLVALG